MFKEWRERKAKNKKQAPPIVGPVFEPILREESELEEMPVVTVEVSDIMSDKADNRVMTAGGVRLNHDQSRSFLQTEEDSKSICEENEEMQLSMKFLYTLAHTYRTDVEDNIERIK